MEKTQYSAAAIFSASVLLLFAGACTRVNENDILIGQQISFSASTEYLGSRTDTRTAYSGEDESGNAVTSSSQYERIDWVPGDQFEVYSPQATHASNGTHFADYAVSSANGSGRNSTATVTPVGDNGLVWGGGEHAFYAVYPNPSTNANASVVKDGDAIRIAGKILREQTATWENDGDLEAQVNMDYAYMFAASTGITPASSVNLYFKPLVTAFKITVTSATDEVLTLNKLRMVSTSCPLSGDFSATVFGATTALNSVIDAATISAPVFADSGDDANNYIEINLGNHTIYKTAGVNQPASATFTVFALPIDLTDLSLELYTSATAATEPRIIRLKQDNAYITFSAGSKAYINSLDIPGAWTYHMADIDPIEINDESVMIDVERTVTVHTYKSVTGMNSVDIPWKMYFTTENPAGWVGQKISASEIAAVVKETPYTKDEAKTEDVTVTDGAYLTPSATTGNGTNNEVTFTIGASPLPPANPLDVTINVAAVKAHYHNLSDPDVDQLTTLRSRQHTDLDLSTYDFIAHSGGLTSETANCYVIDGYGSFRIPLVYGNAIREGVGNPSSYHREGTDSEYLNDFINAEGQAIQSPWILEDAGLTGKTGHYSGRVVWQDTRYGYEIVRDQNISIETIGGHAYMRFTINQNDIKPGNVVIALHDDDYNSGEGMILWSWHLWVFGEELGTRTVSRDGRSATFLTANLGWAAPLKYPDTNTCGRQQYAVIAVNDGTSFDGTILGSFPITQEVYTVPGSENDFYSGTFYQWGSKNPCLPLGSTSHHYKHAKFNTSAWPEYQVNTVDPMNHAICADNTTSTGGDRYNVQANVATTDNKATDLVQSIRNPHIFIRSKNDSGIKYAYSNSWNVTFNESTRTGDPNLLEYDKPSVKSIYDPCPRGFCVPRGRCFFVLMDPTRDGTAEGRDEPQIARGYGDPNVAGAHEIFGDKFTEKYSVPYQSIDGVMFYTDDGRNDLEFRWCGYRGGISCEGQPDHGGFLHSADPRPYSSLPINENTGHVTRNGTWTFLFMNSVGSTAFGGPSFTAWAAGMVCVCNSWGMQVRPVRDIPFTTAEHNMGATISGQGVNDHDASGLSWN